VIRLHTLGSIRLEDTGGRDCTPVVRQQKRLALLAYAALKSRLGPVQRDSLMGVFWPESSAEHARNTLSQTIHFLRHHLGGDVLMSRGEQLHVDTEYLWCDALAFQTAIEEGSPENAMDLYRGELLEGFFLSGAPEFEQWLEAERSWFRDQASAACWNVADALAAQKDHATAAAWARRAMTATPLDEVAVRRLLVFLDGLGDKAGAIAAYEEFRERLGDSYGTTPAAETNAIIESVRAPRSAPVVTEAADVSPEADHAPPSATPRTSENQELAVTGTTRDTATPTPKRAFVLGTAFALVLVAIGGALWTNARNAEVGATVVQRQLTSVGNVLFAVLSPDGRRLAYTTGSWGELNDLWVQEPGGETPSLVLRDTILELVRWYGDNTTLLVLLYSGASGMSWETIAPGGAPRAIDPPPEGFFRTTVDGSRGALFMLDYEVLTVDDSIQLRIPEAPDWIGEVEWSLDGTMLAVVTSRASLMTIWTTPADSEQWTKVITSEDLLQSPQWSPSGDALYYYERENGAWSIRKAMLSDPSQTPVALVTDLRLQSETAPHNLVFTTSSDATTLAYVREQRWTNLWGVDSTGTRQITSDEEQRSGLTLSPDGTQLAYVRQSTSGTDIFSKPIAGGAEAQVTFSGGEKWSPAWSPDQTEIAFGATMEDQGGKVWIVDVATGEERVVQETQLEGESWTAIHWAPSDWILYWVRYTNFHLVDPSTTRMRPAPLFREPRFVLGNIAIDPNGEQVAVAKRVIAPKPGTPAGEYRWVLTVTSMRDGTERQLAADTTQWIPLGWSRDGQWVYVRDVDSHLVGGRRVAAVPVAGGPIRPIRTLPEGQIDDVVLSSDGKQVFYIQLEAESDVWLVEGFDPAAESNLP
jgi:DNA-binding SARP family transcriptional activator/Tol biopolymer transport system component